MKYCLILMSMFLFLKVHAKEEKTDKDTPKVRTKTGLATYYHRKFEGRRTSSGKRYRGENLTAAHRTLPFGTIVTVTNLSNGKSINVEVNDRGPFTKRYIIDVSESAAKYLGIFGKGHSKVEISYDLSGV
jgi:rare lipoprotein A